MSLTSPWRSRHGWRTVLGELAEGLKPGGEGGRSRLRLGKVGRERTQGVIPPGGRCDGHPAQGQDHLSPCRGSKEHRWGPALTGPGTRPWFSYWSSWTQGGVPVVPWVAWSLQVVSAFQVGVSSEEAPHTCGGRGCPAWRSRRSPGLGPVPEAGAALRVGGQTTMDPSPHLPAGNTHPESGACTRGLSAWPPSWG